MSTYFTEGIILKHKDFREADRLLTIYTKDYGKIELIAKGSRKIKSKLAGSLEPFCLARLTLVKGKNFDTITSSEIMKNYLGIKTNFQKIVLANYFVEIIDGLTKIHHRDSRVFDLVKEIFDILDKEKKIESINSFVIWYFAWRFLTHLGYKPELRVCAHCKKTIKPENNYFSLSQGGVICETCNKSIKNKMAISEGAIKVMRIILENDFRNLLLIKISKNLAQEISKITNLFLKYHLEKDLKSERFLAMI